MCGISLSPCSSTLARWCICFACCGVLHLVKLTKLYKDLHSSLSFLWPIFSTGTFVICWTPGLVILLLDGLSCSECQVLKYEKYCLVLAECNSLVNPIIYSFRDKDMRTTYKRILCFPWRRMRQHEGPSGIRFESVKTGAPSEKNSNNFTSLEPSSPQSLLCS